MSEVVELCPMYRDSIVPTIPDDRYSGVKSMWLKVIIRAMFDLASYRDSTKLGHKKLANDAYSWMFGENDLFNGFESICKFLDIDPNRVRARAMSMSKEDVSKIEFRERKLSCPDQDKDSDIEDGEDY